MPRYPSATWRPLTRNYTARTSVKNAVILHTSASGTATSLHGWFSNKNALASSHFHVDNRGRVEQYLDTNHISWANGEGNSRSVTIETQGTGAEPWTPAQITALVALVRWICATHKIPVRQMASSDASQAGIGWHRLGVNGNFPALPSILAGRTQRGGGQVWSKATGKVCPGTKRIHQIPGIIAAVAGTKVPPAVKAADPEYLGDGKTIWPESPLPVTDEHTKDSHNAWVRLMEDVGHSYARLGHQLQAWLDSLGHYPMPPYLHDGVMGPAAVKGLQSFLKAKGHYDGLLDGQRGPMTVRAEIAYLNSQRTYYAADQDEAGAAKPEPTPAPDEKKEAPVASTDPQTVHQPGIDWAKETGLMVGYTDGTFRPNQPVTRGELATILHRYHEKDGQA